MEELLLYKLLAIFGALAWLPSIIEFFRKVLTRPRLTIISDNILEIGYTMNGPIINIRLAFTTEKKEVLIRGVALDLKHEKNDTHLFHWEWFEEELMRVEGLDTGAVIPYKKNQKAIAIKVLEKDLIEKKVGFHEAEYKRSYTQLLKKLNSIFHILKSQEKAPNELKATNEYNAFQDFIKNSFSWKVGVYTATFKVYTDSMRTPVTEHTLQFSLTSLDLKNLEQNISITQQHVEDIFVGQNFQVLNWSWVNTEKHEI